MNRMIAFILLLAIASVRDIAAESNLRAEDNSSSLVSNSQRRELSWWGSFFNAFHPYLLHPPSGSVSSGSGSSSSSSSSSSSGSSTTTDGAYDGNATANAAASDGGWDVTHKDIDSGEGQEWQSQYVKGDTGGSSAGGSS